LGLGKGVTLGKLGNLGEPGGRRLLGETSYIGGPFKMGGTLGDPGGEKPSGETG